MTPKIYISYSWNEEDMVIADTIDKDWQAIGLTLIRDKRDVTYKDSLRDFMSSMSEGDYVLLIISKNYLESKNCMYEALELFKNPDFKKKILPILAPKANIYDAIGKMSYARYWEDKIADIEKTLDQVTSKANLASVYVELDHCTKIRASIDSFSDIISDMRGVSWPAIKKQNYGEIFKYIGYTLDESNILEECGHVLDIAGEEEQEIALEALEAKYKGNPNVLFAASNIAFTRKKYKKSRVFLEKLITSHPRPWKVYNNLATLLVTHFNDPNGAKDYLERALALEPDYDLAHTSLADLLWMNFGDYNGALEHYRKALAISPNHIAAHINFSSLLSTHFKDYKMAMDHLIYASELEPYNLNILYNMAYVAMESGEHDTARKGYEVICRVSPRFKTVEADKYFGLSS